MMPFNITPSETQNKNKLLDYFRERGSEKLAELRREFGNQDFKKLAGGLNKGIGASLSAFTEAVTATAENDDLE